MEPSNEPSDDPSEIETPREILIVVDSVPFERRESFTPVYKSDSGEWLPVNKAEKK